jgi:hypothetical protein
MSPSREKKEFSKRRQQKGPLGGANPGSMHALFGRPSLLVSCYRTRLNKLYRVDDQGYLQRVMCKQLILPQLPLSPSCAPSANYHVILWFAGSALHISRPATNAACPRYVRSLHDALSCA